MKELEEKKIDEVNEVRQSVKKIGEKYLRSFRLKGGQSVWQCNLLTGVVSLAEVKKELHVHNGRTDLKRKITQKEMHIYVPALNWSTALKKFENVLKGKLSLKYERAENI